MCGLAGIFKTNGSQVDVASLRSMSTAMAHRGPDDCGSLLISERLDGMPAVPFDRDFKTGHIFDDSQAYNLGLTHRRLSIIDLSAQGHQPMSNKDKTVWVVYNGEIYNYKNLKQELQAAGCVFNSDSDTEVVIYAYEKWGIDCLQRLRGIFSIGLWDTCRKELFLIRDRVGIKPLYYFQDSDGLCFASEIKSLLKLPEVAPKLNREALAYYFSFLAVPAPQTMFEGIKKVPPATYLRVNSRDGLRQVQYWNPVAGQPEKSYDKSCFLAEAEKSITECVNLRMMSDVPFGAFLSGGIDSSLIVAIMSQNSSTPVNTFTIGYKGLEASNEFRYAAKVAELYKTNHTELIMDSNNSDEIIASMLSHGHLDR